MKKKILGFVCLLLSMFVLASCGGKSRHLNEKPCLFIYRSVSGLNDPDVGYTAESIVVDTKTRIITLKNEITVAHPLFRGLSYIADINVGELQLKIPSDAPYHIYIYENQEKSYYYLPSNE